MSTPSEIVERAFEQLAKRTGFSERPNQLQLAYLLSDLIEQKSRGLFEAPTGLGKSLAALIPALAHAICSGKRIVVATYTNVLAEQYWQVDLPMAVSLFADMGLEAPRTSLLMGRSRYACLVSLDEQAPNLVDDFRRAASQGTESEFRRLIHRPSKEVSALWPKVSSPPVCPGRLCPAYDDCFYYRARHNAETAGLVITNHSVVIQDALMARDSDDGQGMLGSYDFLIIDEAHDFPNAATNGLEFEMSMPKLNSLLSVAGRIESTLAPLAQTCGDTREWSSFVETFREQVQRCETSLMTYGMSLGRPGILTASPSDVLEHPQVKAFQTSDDSVQARELAMHVSTACEEFVSGVEERVQVWKEIAPERARNLNETVRNYGAYLRNYGRGCHSLFSPEGVSVSYVGRQFNDTMLRQDVIDLAGPLKELLWDRMPYACLSATLALDGTFDFFRRVSGAEPDFEEILPSPFNAAIQSSIYIPANGRIPDPTVARRDGVEEAYYRALAGELTRIIVAMGGRTLALFHSRKEMEGVASFMSLPPELPMIVHSKFGASGQGDRFRVNPRVSLFALRSFWTGFDAPGETLSCVALVRIPFEVPVDPPQIARLAFLQTQGRDAFREHTLPNAKMLMRQGAGRLIRRIEDRGVIALLDPRLRSKAYGEEILSNVAGDVAIYDDFLEAMAKVGIDDFALI